MGGHPGRTYPQTGHTKKVSPGIHLPIGNTTNKMEETRPALESALSAQFTDPSPPQTMRRVEEADDGDANRREVTSDKLSFDKGNISTVGPARLLMASAIV